MPYDTTTLYNRQTNLKAFTPSSIIDTNNLNLASSTASSNMALQSTRGGGETQTETKKKGVDVSLLSYFLFWYIGNYYYNITNKVCFIFSFFIYILFVFDD